MNIIDKAKDKTEKFLIGAQYKVSNAIHDFFNNEKGSTVETVIIIAICATLAIAVITLIGNKIHDRANEAADTIGGFGTYNSVNPNP